MAPVATPETTETCRNSSRACGLVMCTSTRGARELGAGVAQRVAVVRERRRVEHHGHAVVGGLVQPADQLGLAVGLPHLDVEPERLAVGRAHAHQVVVRRGAVDLRLARPQPSQVRPVQHQHPTRPSAATLSLSATARSRRTPRSAARGPARSAPPDGPARRAPRTAAGRRASSCPPSWSRAAAPSRHPGRSSAAPPARAPRGAGRRSRRRAGRPAGRARRRTSCRRRPPRRAGTGSRSARSIACASVWP